VDEKFLEQASAIELVQRDNALHQVRAQLQGNGQADCEDCGDPIPDQRRAAAPSAIRCVVCQTAFERTVK